LPNPKTLKSCCQTLKPRNQPQYWALLPDLHLLGVFRLAHAHHLQSKAGAGSPRPEQAVQGRWNRQSQAGVSKNATSTYDSPSPLTTTSKSLLRVARPDTVDPKGMTWAGRGQWQLCRRRPTDSKSGAKRQARDRQHPLLSAGTAGCQLQHTGPRQEAVQGCAWTRDSRVGTFHILHFTDTIQEKCRTVPCCAHR
jgi:hypothetical protein